VHCEKFLSNFSRSNNLLCTVYSIGSHLSFTVFELIKIFVVSILEICVAFLFSTMYGKIKVFN